jgi:hypothetical protein
LETIELFFFFDCEEKNILKGNPSQGHEFVALTAIIWYTRRDRTFLTVGGMGGGAKCWWGGGCH